MSRSLAEKLLTLRSIVLPNLHIEILPYVEYHLVIYNILLECTHQVLLRSDRKFIAQSNTLNVKIFGRFNFWTIPYGPKILVSENCGDI